MANEMSYQYTSTPLRRGQDGELEPTFTPHLARYRSPEEVEPVVFGTLPAIEPGSVSLGGALTLALGIAAGILFASMLAGRRA